MGRKRLITDSFQVVKRQRQDPDTKKGSLQPEVVPVPDDAPPGGSLHPAPLEMLKQFDLSWEYGPCTASGMTTHSEMRHGWPRHTARKGESCCRPDPAFTLVPDWKIALCLY
ncbi:DNA polymerase delta subunit 4 isoform X2 [Trachemys scripta elegans]|uniref:DNA polymerase delta subunit 4 isoform X2 n=1 Tax=Trachemys scripta elegans TaxID=31138 RepID=UPI001551900A|nr:DNA polymerase delta subunit 4 isoform X2 [Trachemys scripta elegans]XP_053883317.1 DNA polymerase delta subunit 4 isoform X2 [Malaclemys terrapin pileata]